VHKGPLVDSDVDYHSDSQSDSDVDSEIRFLIGGLPSDEDDSLERDWALSSRLTGKEAQKLTQVIKFFLFHSFDDERCCLRAESRSCTKGLLLTRT
jgi:hypothetical protein